MPEREKQAGQSPIIERLKEDDFFRNLRSRVSKLINPTGNDYLLSKRKRALDVIGTLVLSPFAFPLVSGAAIAIKLEDGGPVIYIARVIGKSGEEFGMIKLRSMILNADEIRHSTGEQNFTKRKDDSRITKVGKIIRRLSIDELPQLVNVLRGDMSLVGPRPVFRETMNYLQSEPVLSDVYPQWAEGYNLARPGGLGPKMELERASVTHSVEGLRAGMEAETFYLTHASLGEDIKWLFKGIRAIVSQKGAY